MSRRRPAPRGRRDAGLPREVIESRSDGDWFVRRITGATSTKTYTCPGCHRPITPATPHVVAWPVQKALLSEDALDERRHWHTACWGRKH